MLVVVCFIGLMLLSLCRFWVSALGLRCFVVFVWFRVGGCWWVCGLGLAYFVTGCFLIG